MHKTESPTRPKCLFAAELLIKAPSPYELHAHACTEIVYFSKCRGWIVQDKRRYRYTDGSVLVYQSGLQHANESQTTGTHVCIGVVGCGAEQLAPGMWKANRAIESLVTLVRRELRHKRGDQREKLDLLCGLIAIELQQITASTSPRAGRLSYHVRATKGILDSRFTEPLALKQIAEGLFIHPDYLRQLFRRQIGQSPIHYLIRKRLDYACELLRITPEPIQEVARRAGFENAYYFSRLFRKWMNLSPSEYRKRADKDKP